MIRGLAVVALAMASLGLTQAASAQFGAMGGSDDVFRPDYTTRDVVLFVEGLELDEAQRYIFETLFDMYQADFELGVEEVRERLAGMRDELIGGNPQEILNKVFEPVDEWRKKKQGLATRLMLDLQAQLGPHQQDRWPSFERKLRRIKTLKDGVLTGENIDVFFVIQQLDLTKAEKDAVQPVLDQYEVALDAALQARNQYITHSQNDLSTAIRSQDVEGAKNIVEQQVNYRLTVRNTTDQAINDLIAVLPEEKGAQLRRNSLEQAYGQVFRQTMMERMFDQVLAMEDLSEEILNAVFDLESRYNGELAVINDRLVELIRDHDGMKAIERVERLVHRVGGEVVAVREDPVREEFHKRDELDRKYLRDLRAILTPEQFAAIPGSSKVDRMSRPSNDMRPARTSGQRPSGPKSGGDVSRDASGSRNVGPSSVSPEVNGARGPAKGDGGGRRGGDGGSAPGEKPKGSSRD